MRIAAIEPVSPLVGFSVSVLVDGELLGCFLEVIPGPVITRVGNPGCVECILIVIEHCGDQCKGNGVVAVSVADLFAGIENGLIEVCEGVVILDEGIKIVQKTGLRPLLNVP